VKDDSDPQVRITVAKNVKHLPELKTGQLSWWCAPPDARPGDIVVVYKVQHGIQWVLKVQKLVEEEPPWCRLFGMRKAEVEALCVGAKPITFQQLKRNRVLSKTTPVRRSFQGGIFSLTEPELQEVLRLLR